MIDDMELMQLRQQAQEEAGVDTAQNAAGVQAGDFLDARPVEDVNQVSGIQTCRRVLFTYIMHVLTLLLVCHVWAHGWGCVMMSASIRGTSELIPDLLEVWDLVAYFAGVLKFPLTICGTNFWNFCQRLEHPRAQLFHRYHCSYF